MSEAASTTSPPSGENASLSKSPEAQNDLTVVSTSSHGEVQYTRQEEKRLVRKTDIVVVPILLLLYLLGFCFG